jgi:hypothetical protein
MPSQFQWAVADSLLLQSIAQGKPVQRGPAGTRLNTLVKLFAQLRMVYLLLFFVGVVEIAKLLRRQGRDADQVRTSGFDLSERQYPAFIFVGFGAGPEESLFAAYCAEKGVPVARIDQTKVETMGQWHRVGVMQALASLLHTLALARQAMANLPQEFLPWKKDFLSFVGMRLGYFSFASAWFGQLKDSAPSVTEVCFLAPDMAAFAAVSAGLPTRYLQHGLNRHSLLLPCFDRVDALTHDEVSHFRRRMPKADIHLARPVMPPVVPRQPPCLLVASVYGHHDELRRILPFLEFAADHGVAIHVRPHPREDRSFWLTGNFPFALTLEDSDATFDAALERLQPTLVVSWYSTALVDALYRGVIPVSVSACDDLNIQDMVYPLFSHCLHWPSDRNVLGPILSDQGVYEAVLKGLRAGMEQGHA